MSTAESCGGFDWDDAAFDRAYVELEGALFGEGHQYGAIAPVIGITTGGATIELGNGIRIRAAADGRARKAVARGKRASTDDFGRSRTASTCSSSNVPSSLVLTDAPDAPGEFADAVTRYPAGDRCAGRGGPGALRAPRLATVRNPACAPDRCDAARR